MAKPRKSRKKAAVPGREDQRPRLETPAPPPFALDANNPPERSDQDADPTLYNRVFSSHDGQKVLEDLAARYYYVKTYVPGGVEAQRESDARGARRDVIDFIIRRTSMAAVDVTLKPGASNG